nr:hypothetical protein [Tanacetum cinerariifolium]
GKVKLVSEVFIRRYLKLEDSDGISTLPNTEIFEQLALMGVQVCRVKDQQSQLSAITHPQLEKIVKLTKARRRAKIIVSDDEDAAEDTSKQGRKIDVIDQDPDISLVQHDAEVQGMHKQEIEFKTKDISTTETLVYIRRSESKDKGKGIMTKSELVQTSTKLQQRQERAGYEAVVRLQEQLD